MCIARLRTSADMVSTLMVMCLAPTAAWQVIATPMGDRAHSHSTRPSFAPGRLDGLLCMRASKAGEATPAGKPVKMQATAGMLERRQQAAVFSVLIAAFLNLLGFTMALPINVALRSHFSISTGASFGSLSSAYPLGTLGAMFLWPRLSDRAGRRPIITLSLTGSALGLALQCWAVHYNWSLKAFLACRVLTGFSAGAGPVAKAYLADVGAASGQLPKFMAWRDAANTLAFIAGPAIGGFLYQQSASLAVVIGAAAAGSLLASVLIFSFVRDYDTPDAPARATSTSEATQSAKAHASAKAYLMACPLGAQLWAAVATVCVVSAFYNVGSSTFAAFFGPLAQLHAGLSIQGIGAAYTALSAISFLVSTTVAAQAQVVLGTVTTAIVGLCTVAAGLISMGFVAATTPTPPYLALHKIAFWAAAALYQVGVPLFAPTVPTMLLQCVTPKRRGTIMGLDEAMNTIARVVAPIAVGGLYQRHGALACCGTAGCAVLFAAFVAAFRRVVVLRGSYAKTDAP